jgi:transposase
MPAILGSAAVWETGRRGTLLHVLDGHIARRHLMTETTRSTEATAVIGSLYLALELGSTKWTLAFATAPAQRPRLRQIAAGDLAAMTREIVAAKLRFALVPAAPVRSCYKPGRDAFWVHRWLVAAGVHNLVVEASSIEVNRRARRAKTDRLDDKALGAADAIG